MEPQIDNKNRIASVVVGLLLIVVAVIIWFGGNKSEQVPQDENIISSDIVDETPVVIGEVRWNKIIGSRPIKTIPGGMVYTVESNLLGDDYTETTDNVLVFKIGEILSGEYEGKIIALGVPEASYGRFVTAYNYLWQYAYFISEPNGDVVAWDSSLIEVNTNDFALAGPLNFNNIPEKSLDFIKLILEHTNNIVAISSNANFSAPDKSLINLDLKPDPVVVVDKTKSGLSVVKVTRPDTSNVALLPLTSYFIKLPFGVYVGINLEPNFMDENDVPQLSWTVGTKSVASYRYGNYAYGWWDCYDGILYAELQSTLLKTGVTTSNENIYEIDPEKHPQVYQCLHEKTKRYIYNPTTETGNYEDTVSYNDFVQSHPMFFWRHQLGDLIPFVRSDVVPAAEKAKPVIYLYPETTQKVSVKVSPIGGFTKTDPDYGNGWTVESTTNSEITNLADGQKYPYLFWEGGEEGIVDTPKEGFIVAKEDIEKTIDEKLVLFGLNDQERADFLEFWVPKLSKAPYYFITFISRSEIDRVAPMNISPNPESVIRVLMDYKPLTAPISVEPLEINTTERNGFTVVEWGGIVRD